MPKKHIVKKGDNLWNLSRDYNITFQAIKNANPNLEKRNPPWWLNQATETQPADIVIIPDPVTSRPGEIKVPASPVATCTAFKGHVTEVKFDHAIQLIKNKNPVPLTQPQWKKSSSTTYPAAIPIKTAPAIQATIKVEITKSNYTSGNAAISGKLNSLKLMGKCPIVKGEHTIRVKVEGTPPAILFAETGVMIWEIDVSCMTGKFLGATYLELYAIVEDIAYPFLSRGRPVEALQFLYKNIKNLNGLITTSKETDKFITSVITRYCHSEHRLSYDTILGKPQYLNPVPTGLAMKLTEYMQRKAPKCNCYDQASALLVFCGIIGLQGEKIYVEPFGFIKETVLVGNIRSNNPFYKSNNSDPIVPRLDSERTAFGNHEFYHNTSSNKIFDACAGPELGIRNLPSYLLNAVDTSVYDTPPPINNPGGVLHYHTIWKKNINHFNITDLT